MQQCVQQRSSGQNLLEVVQDQQGLPPLQARGEPVWEGSGASIWEPKALRKGGRHLGGVPNGREIDEPDPVWKGVPKPRASLVCEAVPCRRRAAGESAPAPLCGPGKKLGLPSSAPGGRRKKL